MLGMGDPEGSSTIGLWITSSRRGLWTAGSSMDGDSVVDQLLLDGWFMSNQVNKQHWAQHDTCFLVLCYIPV